MTYFFYVALVIDLEPGPDDFFTLGELSLLSFGEAESTRGDFLARGLVLLLLFLLETDK